MQAKTSELDEAVDAGRGSLKTVSAKELDWLRAVCLDQNRHWSLWFFAKVIVGYPDLAIDPHLEMCEFLQSERWTHKLLLCPRDSLKTSLIIAYEVREVLRDPHARVLHSMATEDNAAESAQFVDDIFKQNEFLQAVFPDRIPDFGAVNWRKMEKTCPRQLELRGPSFRWAGTRTKVTGYHYTHIIADDLIEEAAANSEAEHRKVVSFISNFEPLLINTPRRRGKILFTGTRWSTIDYYATIMGEMKQHTKQKLFRADGDPRFVCMKRSALENGKLFWPERLGLDDLAAKRKALQNQGDGHKYFLWYLNEPCDPGLREFPEPNRWFYTPDKASIMLYSDHGPYKGTKMKIDPRDLFRTMTVDVACKTGKRNDPSAITVVGSHPMGWRVVLYAWDGKVEELELCLRILEIHKRAWEEGRPITYCGIEDAQTQWMLAGFIRERAKDDRYKGIPITLKPLKHGSRGKGDRIRGLKPYITDGWMFSHDKWIGLNQELQLFPYGNRQNIIDALAYQEQIWSTSTFEDPEEYPPEEYQMAMEMKEATQVATYAD